MKMLILISTMFLVSSCGALRISPKSCRTEAVWGSSELAAKENPIEIKAKETYYAFTDVDLKLRDLLAENGIKCEEVKSVRVVISTSWLFMRDVSLKVVKK